MSPKNLLEFINNRGNILLTLSGQSPTPTALSSLLLEFDIHLPPDRTSLVIDHLNYDTISATEKHDVLLLPQPSAIRADVKNFFGGDGVIAFPRAVAQELGNSSPHLAPIIHAKGTAYSYNPKDDAEGVKDPFAVGEQISLASSLQARNSARFTVLGSVEALEDTWFDAKVKGLGGKQRTTANRQFAKQITAWTFMETGVLKVGRVEHHLSSIDQKMAGNDSVVQLGYLNPKIYRVKNDVVSTLYLQHPALVLQETECGPCKGTDDLHLLIPSLETQAPKTGMRQVVKATKHRPNYRFLSQACTCFGPPWAMLTVY